MVWDRISKKGNNAHTFWFVSSFLSFGNVFGLDSPFFQTFLTFILLPRLVTTHHVHMTYIYSFFHVLCSHFTQSHGQEKSLSYYDLLDFGVIILQMHLNPHFLFLLLSPLLPQPHHHNTHHLSLHSTAQLEGECD